MLSHRLLLCLALLAPALSLQAQEGGAPMIEIFHESGCRPCGEWEAQLRANGFAVRRNEVVSVASTRRWLAVPENFASFVTSRTGGYIIEGPVPPTQIRQLLKEKPVALGLARAGVPAPAAQTELMFWGGRSAPFPVAP